MKQPQHPKLGPNAVLAFAIELVAIGVYFWAPFAYLNETFLITLLTAFASATVFITLWATLAAPKSKKRLRGMALVVTKLILLLPAALLLTWRLSPVWMALAVALVFATVLIEWRDASLRKQ